MSASLVENPSKTNNGTKEKVPTMKFFIGEESGLNVTVLDSLVVTGMVTKENLTIIMRHKDTVLNTCNGKSLVLATLASNGLIKNIGYVSANDGTELFESDIPKAYQAIHDNELIPAVSSEDFIRDWTAE